MRKLRQRMLHVHVTVHRPRLRDAIEACRRRHCRIGRTLQDLVRANLLLGGASESSGLLVGSGRAVDGITCSRSKNTSQPSYDERHWLWGPESKIEMRTASDGGSKGASDSRSGGDAASRGDGGALQEHCCFIGSGLRLAMRMTREWAEREVEVLSRDL